MLLSASDATAANYIVCQVDQNNVYSPVEKVLLVDTALGIVVLKVETEEGELTKVKTGVFEVVPRNVFASLQQNSNKAAETANTEEEEKESSESN